MITLYEYVKSLPLGEGGTAQAVTDEGKPPITAFFDGR